MEILTMAQAIDALNSGKMMVYKEGDRYVGIKRASAETVQAAIRNTIASQGPLTEAVLYNRVGRAHTLTPMGFRNILEMTEGLTLVTNKWVATAQA
jgi:hypothetical protein